MLMFINVSLFGVNNINDDVFQIIYSDELTDACTMQNQNLLVVQGDLRNRNIGQKLKKNFASIGIITCYIDLI